MALLKFGAVIVDSRGAVGGVTLKATRGGLVMQRKSTPTTTATQRTSTQRARLAELSQDWRATLTGTQRDAWRALAAANPVPDPWGTTWPLSGLALYIRANLNLLTVGQSKLTDAPLNQAATAVATASIAITAPATASLTFTPTPTPANHLLLIDCTPKLSAGLSVYDPYFRTLAHGAAAQTSPWNIAAAWTALFGNFSAGSQYAVRVQHVNTDNGARSAPLIAAVLAS